MSAPPQTRVDEDEDLDDLDDVLEQFAPPPGKAQLQPPPSGTTASSASKPQSTASASDSAKSPFDLSDLNFNDDFTLELTRGMESLMREIADEAGLDPEAMKKDGASGDDADLSEDEKKREEAFRAAWEKMLVESMNGALDIDELSGSSPSKGKTKDKSNASGGGSAAGADDDTDAFQASIRKAMEKLKESDANLQAETPDSVDDIMAKLSEGLDLGGAESEEDLQRIFEDMMTQLMSKEILYEPLKELYTKFPGYLKDNATTISAEDKKRYDSQYAVVEKIIAIFEEPGYSDANKEQSSQIVTLMTEMQSHGSPPADIMGPLPPGLNFGPDGLPKVPEGCIVA